MIKVEPIKTPGQVQDSTKLENDDFDNGLKEQNMVILFLKCISLMNHCLDLL